MDITSSDLTRRRVLQLLAASGLLAPGALALAAQSRPHVSAAVLKDALAIVGGEPLSDERLRVVETALQRNLDQFQIVRDFAVADSVEPAPVFLPTRPTT